MTRKILNISLPAALADRIRKEAAENNMTISEYFRNIYNYYSLQKEGVQEHGKSN